MYEYYFNMDQAYYNCNTAIYVITRNSSMKLMPPATEGKIDPYVMVSMVNESGKPLCFSMR